MEAFIPILAILAVFGIPGYLALRAMELRHQRKLRESERAEPAQLEGMVAERKLLLERIENLESIVCSVDFELNQKLNRLVLESGLRPALPAAASEPAAGEEPPENSGGSPAAHESTAFDPASPKHRRAEPSTHELELGALVGGRYHIQRLLGRGGMGAVYLADDRALGEPVALKVVSSSLALDPEQASERFRREAQAARRIAHPNVIRIHDLGADGSLLYISMEYFPGKTLSRLLEARGAFDRDGYRDLLVQVCDGLAAAHAAGVVHRDLKPGNVLVGERSAVKLIDFGLATSELMKGLTATGQMLGTPHYMSPEQVRGTPCDARSDIYSLGALAYHMVVGKPPFEGSSPIAVGFAHLMEPVPDPRAARPELEEALAAGIARALAKQPGDRPQTIAAFRKALEG